MQHKHLRREKLEFDYDRTESFILAILNQNFWWGTPPILETSAEYTDFIIQNVFPNKHYDDLLMK